MVALIARVVELCRRHAALVAAGFLVFALAAGVFAAQRISINTDTDKLINPKLPWRQQEAALERAFPQNVNLLAIVIDGETPDESEDAAARLAAALAAQKTLFESVRQPGGGEFFRRNGLLFLSKDEVQQFADQIIAAQPLIGTLAADPSLRGVFTSLDLAAQGAAQGAVEPQELDVSFNTIAAAVEATLAGRHAPLSWQTLLTGRKAEPSELRRFVLTQPVLDYADVEPGARATAAIRESAKSLGLTPENGVRVRITGPVALSDAQFATLAEGAGTSSLLSIGLLCLWLLLALRSLRLVVALVATLIVGLVACAAFAVAAVGPLNPISAAFAVLFIGIAIDFGIQFSVRYRDERHRSDDLAVALSRTALGIGGPLAIAGAATAVGFLSFVPTDYIGVSDLGLIAGAGMLIALVLNLTLLPALLTLLRPRGERDPVGFAWAAPVNFFLQRRRAMVMAITALLVLGSAVTLRWLSFDFNPLNLQNPRAPAVATLFDLMRDPSTTPYTIDILSPSAADAAQLAQRIDKLPEVAQVITAGSFVPEEQAEKLAILQDAALLFGPTLSPPQVMPEPSAADSLTAIKHCDADLAGAIDHGSAAAARLHRALSEVLARGAAVVPALQASLADGIGRRLDDLRAALTAQPVALDTLPPELRSEWIADDGRARIEVFPKGDARDNAVLRRFADAVRAIAPDATGAPVTIQESARTVIRAFAIAGAIAMVVIAALLIAVLRRLSDVVLVLVPLLIAGILTLATSVLLGLPLNFANIITLPLLLGVGVAFDIYFVMRWRAGHDDLLQSSTARAILFSALTTGTAFGSLALSNYPGMAEMGKLLTLALFFTLICTFFVLPAMLGPVRRSPEPDARR
ncbi:MAG TPA: MMPL family transporter [Stellaceae bacterium]|nr:MMPL family transporter [Stellaceae bacterium]